MGHTEVYSGTPGNVITFQDQLAPGTYATLQSGDRVMKLKHFLRRNFGASSKPGTASVSGLQMEEMKEV